MRDIRVAPEGAVVHAVFWVRNDLGTFETFGPPIEIGPRTPFVHSDVVDRTCVLEGTIWWNNDKVLHSKPLLCNKGDTFTFRFEGVDDPDVRVDR